MEMAMQADAYGAEASAVPKGRVVTGRVIATLVTIFLVFDAAMKFVRPASVLEAFTRTGWPAELSIPLGAILLTATILYVIPRTAVLGAVLLTAYLGGAVATNLRLEEPLFTNTLFPVYFGVLIWVSLLLRRPWLAQQAFSTER